MQSNFYVGISGQMTVERRLTTIAQNIANIARVGGKIARNTINIPCNLANNARNITNIARNFTNIPCVSGSNPQTNRLHA